MTNPIAAAWRRFNGSGFADAGATLERAND